MTLDLAPALENMAEAGDIAALLTLARDLEAEGDGAKAREWLARGARAGHAAAKAAFGRNLITREPFDALQGVEWTRQAADDGHAEALHLMAVLSAQGLGVPQDWNSALDRLQRAAEGGHPTAQAGLAALAEDWDMACDAKGLEFLPSDRWARYRQAVDLGRWLASPRPSVLSSTPRIFLVTGFLTPSCCDWLIRRSRPHLKRAQTFDNRTGELGYEQGRSNSAVQIPLLDSDMPLVLVRERIAACIGIAGIRLEDSSVLHYAPGEEYRPHFDFFEMRLPGTAREIAARGQRVLTFLVYLNEDYEGGETGFPRIGKSFKGKKGDALAFWNVKPDLSPDPLTLHAGMPPLRGDKWLFSQWVRHKTG